MTDPKTLHRELNKFVFDKDYSGARNYVSNLSPDDYLGLHDLVTTYALRSANLASLVEDVRYEQNHHGRV